MPPNEPLADRAMITAISRKDMVGLKRALATGANANKVIRKNAWDGNINPLLLAAEYGWSEAFGPLLKAGAKRRAAAGTSALAILAKSADAKGVAALVQALGKLTGTELVEGLDQLRQPILDKDRDGESLRVDVERVFRAMINGVPDKISAKDRVRCAQSMFAVASLDFQFAMGPRRVIPLFWAEEVGRALPVSRRMISKATPGIDDSLTMFTLMACAAAVVGGGLPDMAERLDIAGRDFSIDLGAVLAICNSASDVVGKDVWVFEAAAARQSKNMMKDKVAISSASTTSQPRM